MFKQCRLVDGHVALACVVRASQIASSLAYPFLCGPEYESTVATFAFNHAGCCFFAGFIVDAGMWVWSTLGTYLKYNVMYFAIVYHYRVGSCAGQSKAATCFFVGGAVFVLRSNSSMNHFRQQHSKYRDGP